MGRPQPEGEELGTASPVAAAPDSQTTYYGAPLYPPPPPPVSSATYTGAGGPQAPYPPPAAFAPSSHVPYVATPPRPVVAASPYNTANFGRPWSTGIFDCGLNESNAVMTAFFPCVTFGQIAEILDEGSTSCTLGSFMYILMVPALLTCWIIGSNYRKKLRDKYNLVQAPNEDWTVHLFCPCCALCQEFRELQHRGIDPSLGWMGYVAQQQHGTTTVPPMKQFMSN